MELRVVTVSPLGKDSISKVLRPNVTNARALLALTSPSLYIAENGGSNAMVALTGRSAYTADVMFVQGCGFDLLKAATTACLFASILEGRRVLCTYVDETTPAIFAKVLEDMAFIVEGTLPPYVRGGKGTDMYSHVWVVDGLPKVDAAWHVVIGQNDGTRKHYLTNMDLIAKDRDLNREVEGVRFSDRVKAIHDEIVSHANVSLVELGNHG